MLLYLLRCFLYFIIRPNLSSPVAAFPGLTPPLLYHHAVNQPPHSHYQPLNRPGVSLLDKDEGEYKTWFERRLHSAVIWTLDEATDEKPFADVSYTHECFFINLI